MASANAPRSLDARYVPYGGIFSAHFAALRSRFARPARRRSHRALPTRPTPPGSRVERHIAISTLDEHGTSSPYWTIGH